MTLPMFVVILLLVVSVLLFATERFRVDLVALMIMAALLLTGIITPEQGISGFSNTATVTVAAMFVLSAGLYRTGAVNFVGTLLVRLGNGSIWVVTSVMMVILGVVSAFINNTAAVAIFLPIVLGVARDMGVSPSKLLMPLSFASMFGGLCTLIGTSTNILVASIAERHGQPPISMFEMTPAGLIFFAAGVVYMIGIGIRLIPNRRTDSELTETYGMGDYLTEIVLLPNSRSIGSPLATSPLVRELGVAVLGIDRKGDTISIPHWDTVLQEGDVLRVRCNVEKIKKIDVQQGIAIRSGIKWRDQDLESEEVSLVEAVIAPSSTLDGKSLKDVRFRQMFNATALALRHRGQLRHERVARSRLVAGDVLLLEVRRDHLSALKQMQDFVLVSEIGLPRFRKRRMLSAVLIITAVVASTALGLVPIVVAAIGGTVLMNLTGCLRIDELYEAIDWHVIMLLAGVLTLGTALEETGAATYISDLMVSVIGHYGPVALLSAFFLLAMLLTSAMSNNATAALLAPIVIATAESLNVNSRPFLMAIMFASSLSFMTPVGYQTNTLIYGPGQYRYSDFLRVGTPLSIMFWILATFLIPLFWPL